MTVQKWMPCSWQDGLAGCKWLPRLLEKGRQTIKSERQGEDLMNGYLFGDNDVADAQLLTFLHTNDTRVRQLLLETEDDETVAQTLIAESGRSPEEIQARNETMYKKNAPFLAMMDADEGRRKPGLGTTLLRLFYNYLLLPPAYLVFRFQEKRRQS
ncbi:MAG: DUF5069 domain-containing protein [Candidatus Latescibacteria bacterium]|nr:DUF5069 domain-containing protein [Candidatus Latescibacterota bacterium]